MADLYAINPEDQFIGAFRISNLAVVSRSWLRWKLQLVEVAEILGPISLAFFRYRHTRKGQSGVDSGNHIIGHEDIQRQAVGKVQQIHRDKAVVQVAGGGLEAARAHPPFQRNRTLLRRLEHLGGKVHVLGVVQNLHLVVTACQRHRRHAQPVTLHDHNGVWLTILPEGAVWLGEAAILPGWVLSRDNRAIVPIDNLAPSLVVAGNPGSLPGTLAFSGGRRNLAGLVFGW